MERTRFVAWVKRTRFVAWVKQNDFNDVNDYRTKLFELGISDRYAARKSRLTGQQQD